MNKVLVIQGIQIQNILEKKTTNVSAVWSLSTKGPGSLAKDKGEANVFSAKQPGTVRVTAKVGSISKDATIEVKEHVLREIKVQTSASAVKPSEVVQLVAKGFDAKRRGNRS
ncbi:hypothetical protein GCM10020331_055340 [Ectobacillus funiculus]